MATIGTQLYMVISATDKARDSAIQQWESSNPDGARVVQRYREACEGKITSSATPNTKPAQTFAECSAQVGSDSLANAISKASSYVAVPAPLRWL